MKTYKQLTEEIKFGSIGSYKVSNNIDDFELSYKKDGNKYLLTIQFYGKKNGTMYTYFEKLTRKYDSNISSRGSDHEFKVKNLSKKDLKTIIKTLEKLQ